MKSLYRDGRFMEADDIVVAPIADNASITSSQFPIAVFYFPRQSQLAF